MTKALIGLLAAFAASMVPTTASANCYFIYGPKNQLLYRSTISPVDLSRPISEGLRGRFSGGHLVMIPDETGCPDLLASGESQLFAALGFTSPSSGRTTSAIAASPLFRNVAPRAGSESDEATPPGADSAPRLPGRRVVPPAPAGASRGK